MGTPEEDQEYLKLPVEERCVHKLWKARLSGYEEATKLFNRWDGDEAGWKKYNGIVKKFVIDSNAIAQEKGLEAVLAYVENCDAAPKCAHDVADGLVNKVLGAPKAKTKDLGKQVALGLCQAEAHEALVEALIDKGLKQKNPKAVAGTLSALTECLKCFGAKVIKVSPLLKGAIPLLDHRDKTIREEGKALIIESYRWVGDIMKQQLSGVKPVQLTELEEEFAKVQEAGKAKPTRYLKSQMPAMGGGGAVTVAGDAADGDAGGEEEEEEEAMDPYDLMDPVDILEKLPKNFYQLTEEKKWQLRKEALDALLPLSQTPKIAPGDYHELISCLKKFVAKDTNVMLVALAVQCLTGLAKGMRQGFKGFASNLLPVALEKLKEKKINVVNALKELLDALYPVLGIEAVQEDCLAALKHKTPGVVAETSRFLARSFARCPPQLMSNKKCLKGYVSSLQERLAHSDGNVRDAAAEALGVLVKFLGEPTLTKLMPDLEKIKLDKIKECAEAAELTGKPPKVAAAAPPKAAAPAKKGPKIVKPAPPPKDDDDDDDYANEFDDAPPPAASKPAAKKTSVNKPVFDKSKVRSKIGSAPSGGARKAGGPSVPGKLALRPNTAGGGGRKKGEEAADTSPLYSENALKTQRFKEEAKFKVLKWNFTTPRQEFVDQLKEQLTTAGFNTTLMTQMFHSDFKQHLKAIESLHGFLSADTLPALQSNLDLVLKWLTLRFFETNPSVLLKGLAYLQDVFSLLAEADYHMHEIEASSFAPYLINKVGDPKDPVRNSVKAIIKKMGNVYPASKMSAFLMAGLASKNAKQRAECLDELGHLIRGFGSSVLQPTVPQNLKEIAKQISDRDNGVRNAALNCIAETYFQDGDKLYKVIGNLKDKDMAMLEERIKRQAKTRPLPGCGPVAQQQQQQPQQAEAPRRQMPEESAPPPAAAPSSRLPGASRINSATMTRRPAASSTAGGVPLDGPPPPTRQTPNKGPRPVSGAFTLDLDKIESAVDNIGETGLRLVNHKLDDIFNDEPVTLPQTVTGSRRLQHNHNNRQQAALYPSPPRSGEPPLTLSPPGRSNGNYRGQNEERPLTDMPEAYEALDAVIAQIFNQDTQTCIAALAQLDELMKDEEKVQLIGQRMDQLLVACYNQYRHILHDRMNSDNYDPAEVVKLYQFLTMVLMSAYHHQDLTRRASLSSLHDLTHVVLCILLEPRVSELPQGGALIRAFNVLTVKIVERSEHTLVTCALVRLLREAVSSTSLPPKYTELVMKCLWKVIRALPNWIEEVDLDVLMVELHDFLKSYPSTYWKKQQAENGVADTPLRTVKTILHTLAKLKGEDVMNHMSRVQDPENSELVPYLRKLLHNGIGKENANNAAVANGNQANGEKAKKSSITRFTKSDHDTLADIFKKIGQKELTKIGLQELYNFKKQNPQADLEPFLAKSSQYFRDYIERGLRNIEAEIASGGGGGNVLSDVGASNRGENGVPPPSSTVDPSAGGTQSSHYLHRLKKLREQAGLTEGGGGGGGGERVRQNAAASNVAAVASGYKIATTRYDEQYETRSSTTTTSSAESTATSGDGVEDIRKRLQRLKYQQAM